MPKTLRLTKTEEKQLHEKCIEINKALIGAGKMPMRESELAHKILEKTIRYTKINKSGDLTINNA